MPKPGLRSVVLLGAGLICLGAPAGAFTTYTNRAAWEAALAGFPITTDPFNTSIDSAQSITLDSGIISLNSGPITLPNPPYNNNSVAAGVYGNATQNGTPATASNSITWTFPAAVRGFGADFISASMGRLTLSGDFDGMGPQTLTVYNAISGSDGFLGVIGSTPFSTVVYGNNTTTVDGFSIDNASFSPVPGPLPILGASAAYGWSRRLRRRTALDPRRG